MHDTISHMKNVSVIIGNVFNTVLDIILPRRERNVRTQAQTPEDIPVHPHEHTMQGKQIATLMDYREPVVEDLIRSLKYDGSAHAAGLCADILADFLREEITSARLFSTREILLIPVPLHKSRERERGFNQIELVLKRLPQEFRDGTLSRLALDVLSRVRATQQQTHLSRSERMKNVSGAFQISREDSVRGSHIFLIDDVVTTGATLTNAGKPLEALGATVTLLALAHA